MTELKPYWYKYKDIIAKIGDWGVTATGCKGWITDIVHVVKGDYYIYTIKTSEFIKNHWVYNLTICTDENFEIRYLYDE